MNAGRSVGFVLARGAELLRTLALLAAFGCVARGPAPAEAEPPDPHRIRVKPVFLVPTDAEPPTEEYRELLPVFPPMSLPGQPDYTGSWDGK